MSKTEDIHTSMWGDPDFEALGRDASLLLIWSWTNPRCGMAGLYKVSRRAMTESKVHADDLDVALDELREARMVFYEDNVIFVRARVKRLRQKSPSIAKAIKKDVGLISPDHPLRAMFLAEYGMSTWLRGELGGLTGPQGDPHGGATGGHPQTPQVSQTQTPPVGGLSAPQGNGNGKGTGTGNGKGITDRRARADIEAWGREYLPEIDTAFVVMAASQLSLAGHEVTADAVRDRLRATYPDVLEEAA